MHTLAFYALWHNFHWSSEGGSTSRQLVLYNPVLSHSDHLPRYVDLLRQEATKSEALLGMVDHLEPRVREMLGTLPRATPNLQGQNTQTGEDHADARSAVEMVVDTTRPSQEESDQESTDPWATWRALYLEDQAVRELAAGATTSGTEPQPTQRHMGSWPPPAGGWDLEGQAALRVELVRQRQELLTQAEAIGERLEELRRLQEAQLGQQQTLMARQQAYLEAMRLANEQAATQGGHGGGSPPQPRAAPPSALQERRGPLEEGVDF